MRLLFVTKYRSSYRDNPTKDFQTKILVVSFKNQIPLIILRTFILSIWLAYISLPKSESNNNQLVLCHSARDYGEVWERGHCVMEQWNQLEISPDSAPDSGKQTFH